MIIIHNFFYTNCYYLAIFLDLSLTFKLKVSKEFVEHAKLLPEITVKLCVHTTTTLQQKRCQINDVLKFDVHIDPRFALCES